MAPLTRYVAAATLARSADGGAGLGLVLLALTPGAHLHRPATVGGLLVAALSAPHLAGPLVARRLDTAADGRRVLALAFAGYAVSLAAAALLIGSAPIGPVAGLVVTAGLFGPLLTGGLSSRLRGIADETDPAGTDLAGTDPAVEPRARRRADGWDAVTFGLGGTLGPALVAALASVTSPLLALLTLSLAAVAASALVLGLPAEPAVPLADSTEPLSTRAAVAVIVHTGALRRVTYATMAIAMTGGATAILGVRLGSSLSARPSAGAVLAATFGLGNLVGSLLVTWRPLRGEPERLTTRWVAVLAAG